MAVLIAEFEEKRSRRSDRRTSRQISAERRKAEEALVVCAVLMLALLAGFALGYYGGAVQCQTIIDRNTAEVTK